MRGTRNEHACYEMHMKLLLKSTNGKEQLRRPKGRWEDNIKVELLGGKKYTRIGFNCLNILSSSEFQN
jgi:hypothetical protein